LPFLLLCCQRKSRTAFTRPPVPVCFAPVQLSSRSTTRFFIFKFSFFPPSLGARFTLFFLFAVIPFFPRISCYCSVFFFVSCTGTMTTQLGSRFLVPSSPPAKRTLHSHEPLGLAPLKSRYVLLERNAPFLDPPSDPPFLVRRSEVLFFSLFLFLELVEGAVVFLSSSLISQCCHPLFGFVRSSVVFETPQRPFFFLIGRGVSV